MDRRRFVLATSGLVLSGVASRAFPKELAYPSKDCESVRHITPGPFLTPGSPLRSDIREGLPGVPLELELKVVNDIWCRPVEGAVVDIWQCDAIGRYSNVENLNFDLNTLQVTGTGLDTRGKSFLRGHQVTGKDGVARFTTVFPGWYVPRLPHLHVKVTYRDIDWTASSTQLFFPAEIEREVFRQQPYAGRGANPIDIDRDLVMKGDAKKLAGLTVALRKDGNGYRGSFEIGMTAL